MFREALVKYMENKEIDQSTLADKLEITPQAVSDFMLKDTKVRRDTREKYFNKLEGFKNY